MQQLMGNDADTTGSSATEMQQFLSFTIGNETYGINIMTVKEIKGWTETMPLPNSPEFMRGVLNLRGLIVPIFDLRTRFGLGVTEANEKNVIIILSAGERIIGILVDTVSDILDSSNDEIKPAPKMDNNPRDAFIGGIISVGERMVILLDVNSLFDAEILNQAVESSAKM